MSAAPKLDPISTIWWAIAHGADQGVGASYLLHEGQLEMRRLAERLLTKELRGRVCTFRMARRFGKSRWMTVDFMEHGVRRKPSPWRMKYGASTQVDAMEIVMEHAEEIARDIPAPIRPYWHGSRSSWMFADGSHCKVVGCDDQRKADRLRGRSMDRGYVDEPGSIPDLRYVMRSVLLPQLLTTGGIILYAGTPSATPAHESSGYFREAEAAGRGYHRTIYEAPHISDAVRIEFLLETCPELSEQQALDYVAQRSGPREGMGSSDWWREYMAEFVVDETRAVVPEFARHEEDVVVEVKRPAYFHSYVSMDVGFHDLTFVGFAYLHFDLGKLVIEDEAVFRHTTSKVIDEAVDRKERRLWAERERPVDHPDKWDSHEPVARVVDAADQTIADLCSFHGRRWTRTDKDDADAALNNLRLKIATHKLLIHPRCVQLRDHLKHAIWNKSRTTFERSGDFGHFDGVDMSKYLVRRVSWQRNPYPRHWQGQCHQTHWLPPKAPRTSSQKLGAALTGKPLR